MLVKKFMTQPFGCVQELKSLFTTGKDGEGGSFSEDKNGKILMYLVFLVHGYLPYNGNGWKGDRVLKCH